MYIILIKLTSHSNWITASIAFADKESAENYVKKSVSSGVHKALIRWVDVDD